MNTHCAPGTVLGTDGQGAGQIREEITSDVIHEYLSV